MTGQRLEIRAGLVSERGRRDENQDYAACAGESGRDVRGVAAMVADGLGGHRGGREAAELTVRGFLEGYYGLPETLGVERAAARALSAMNRWVYTQGRQDPNLDHMATTFSAVLLRGRQAHIVHVGDSRIYRLRGGRLQRLTEDHTLAQREMRHVLYRAVGMEREMRADYAVHSLEAHDRFLLCSDGVNETLPDTRLLELMSAGNAPEESARCLVEAALVAGSQDNATALVIDVIGLPATEQDELALAISALPIQELPKSGDQVDGFHLQERLSEGRYSRLFKAEDTREQGRVVVLKFPHPRVASEEEYRLAFVREAWIAARARSPWVGEVIELPAGRQTRLYSVQPYYAGETLEQRLLRAPPISLTEGVDIAIKLAKAVHALNRRRIIHRDIKPDNVLLLQDGGLKLLDLGVARLPGFRESADSAVPGTPSYMAPEMFDGARGDEYTDLYALGVTLYRLWSTGRYPYGEVEVFSRPRFHRRTPLTQCRPDLPAWLDSVLAQALAVTPDKRLHDALELAAELENGLARGGHKKVGLATSWYERHPVFFWQIVSAILLLLLLSEVAFRR